jgi:hypothetical protein
MDILSYNSVKDKEATFIAMTSLTADEFEILYIYFEKSFDDCNQKKGYLPSKGGRKSKLKTKKDMLFFILFYLKTYPLQEVLAHSFGISQGQANYWVHKLSIILNNALADNDYMPERIPEEMIKKLEEENLQDLSIDGTERRVNRPKDHEEQKKKYSGKKKAHTIKNTLIVGNNDRQVKYLGITHEGKKHDKKSIDEESIIVPEDTDVYVDTAYVGLDIEGSNIYMPKKKPIGKELSDEDKAGNTILSSIRVIVENVIAGVKRCRILKDVYRNRKEKFDDIVMLISCGLHNFRSHNRHHSY